MKASVRARFGRSIRGVLWAPLLTAALILPAMAGLASCSPAPLPATETVSWQDQLQSAQHWNDLAGQLSQQLDAFLQDSERFAGRPVRIAPPRDPSTFDRTFVTLLEGHLADLGVPVVRQSASGDADAVVLDYRLVKIRHDREARESVPTGLLTAAGRLAGGASFDASLPTAEVLFSASVYDSDIILFRQSRLYYVPRRDLRLYGMGTEAATVGGQDGRAAAATGAAGGAAAGFVSTSFQDAEARCRRAGQIALAVEPAGDAGDRFVFDCVDQPYLHRRERDKERR